MFYNVIFLMTVIRKIEMQPVDYLSLAVCVMHFHSSNDRFGFNIICEFNCCLEVVVCRVLMLFYAAFEALPRNSFAGGTWPMDE